METREEYWVFEWLDRHKARSMHKVRHLLLDPVALEDLRQGAQSALKKSARGFSDSESILAGRGIDLSGQLDCFVPDWRKEQAQNLFSKVWHYFDRIVIEDSIAHELTMHGDNPRLRKFLLWHFEVLLYLQEIGASPLLAFRPKPAPCEVHLARHVEEASLSEIIASEDEVVRMIVKKAAFAFETEKDGSIGYSIDFPEFGHTQWGTVSKASAQHSSEGELKRTAARQVFEKFLAYLASDVRAAKFYEIPLGAGIPFHERLLRKSIPATVADVAMKVSLPVIVGLSPALLLKIREDERDHFNHFRTQLRLAIQERLEAVGRGDSGKVAAEIQRDMIAPELATIRTRLAAAKRSAVKKSTAGVCIGALATACGLLATAAPPAALLVGIGVGTAILGNAINNYVDERNEIALSRMYFAWIAEKYHEDLSYRIVQPRY